MERKIALRKFSPFKNYTFKTKASDANGGKGIFIPKYESGQ